jgi:hypothetical protein
VQHLASRPDRFLDYGSTPPTSSAAVHYLKLTRTNSLTSGVCQLSRSRSLTGRSDRLRSTTDKGRERLFPEWDVYVRKDGTQRWSQPLSKAWQYVKKLLKLSRADLTLYSTRHLMADWLDSDGIAQRTRDRILGHASDVRGRYGRKDILDPQIAAKIEALEPPVIKQMREILPAAKTRADTGGLTVLKTC